MPYHDDNSIEQYDQHANVVEHIEQAANLTRAMAAGAVFDFTDPPTYASRARNAETLARWQSEQNGRYRARSRATYSGAETDKQRHYAEKALQSACAEIAATPQGARNDTLNAAAYGVARYAVWWGWLGEQHTWDALADASRACGLQPVETRATLASAFGARHAQTPTAPPELDDMDETRSGTTGKDNAAQNAKAENVDHATDSDPKEPTTWEPIDLDPYLSGEIVQPEPTLGIARSDGLRLIYPGKEHAILGETESGKTWYALGCVAVELINGNLVVYIHYEEPDATSTIERLRLLGLSDNIIRERLRFIAPMRPVHADWRDELVKLKPTLVVHDGVN
jgi:hypothetical protein